MRARRAAGTKRDRFWLGVGHWFSYIWASFGVLLMVAGAALLGLGPGQVWAYLLGIGASLVGAVWELWKGRRYAQLDASMEAAGSRALERSTSLNTILDSALRVLMSDLSVDFDSARVSVYRHLDESFILLARVSQSLKLEKVGRDRYPDSQGVIGLAWDSGGNARTKLPEIRSEWNDECVKRYGMDPTTAAELTMHARSLVGRRIDTIATPPRPIGLIVIESLKARGVEGATLDELDRSPIYPLLRAILIEVIQCLDEQDVSEFRESLRLGN